MKITSLGQAGFFIETQGKKIIIDPFFSDCAEKIDPKKYRRVKAREEYFDLRPDFLLFTHDHLDHYDPETAERYLLSYTGITVIAPRSVYLKAKALTRAHNYLHFAPRTRWTQDGIVFSGVRAFHSDEYALGYVISAEGKNLYFTGDSLYNDAIFQDLPERIDAMFLPVNGAGNNFNFEDAALFAQGCGAKRVFPCHCGVLDDLDPADFPLKGREILRPYESILL